MGLAPNCGAPVARYPKSMNPDGSFTREVTSETGSDFTLKVLIAYQDEPRARQAQTLVQRLAKRVGPDLAWRVSLRGLADLGAARYRSAVVAEVADADMIIIAAESSDSLPESVRESLEIRQSESEKEFAVVELVDRQGTGQPHSPRSPLQDVVHELLGKKPEQLAFFSSTNQGTIMTTPPMPAEIAAIPVNVMEDVHQVNGATQRFFGINE